MGLLREIVAFLCVFLPGMAFNASAQTLPLRFENYTTENGLPQNSGYSIAQTTEGFMWFGTQDGLCRFDGYDIKIYKKTNSPYSICNNFIKALVTDNNSNLWIGTAQGISIYQPKTGKFFSPGNYFQIDAVVDKKYTTGFKKDIHGNIWIRTDNDEIFCFDAKKKSIKKYSLPVGIDTKLRRFSVNELGSVCISTDDDLFIFDGQQFNPFNIQRFIPKYPGSLELRDFVFTHGELWISSNSKGIFRLGLNGTPHLLEQITTLSEQWGLLENEIEYLQKDSKGNVWVATPENGVYMYDYITNTIRNGKHDDRDNYSIKRNYVIYVFEDMQGVIWLGLSGAGIAKCSENKNYFQNISFTENKYGQKRADNMINALHYDTNSDFYVGTQAGGMIKSNDNFFSAKFYVHEEGRKNSLIHNLIRGFAKDDEGKLWVITIAGLCKYVTGKKNNESFISYSPDSSALYKSFNTIIKLRHQNALLIGGNNGLFLFDLTTNKWATIADPGNYAKMNKIAAINMAEINDTTKGTVLIGTEGLGLISYNYITGDFKDYENVKKICPTIRYISIINNELWLCSDNGLINCATYYKTSATMYGRMNGLNDEVVYALLPDARGKLWVSTNHGISCFDTAKKTFYNYGAMFGLGGSEFNTACCARGKNGVMYFGGVSGITRFFPEKIPFNSYAPAPFITGISVMNKEYVTEENISFTKSINLAYYENFVTFKFAAPNFIQTAYSRYRYKLSGINKDWIDAGNSTVAPYTNLPAGKYIFVVNAANNEGIWSKNAATIQIIIHTPFWATWWFRVCCIIIVLLLVALLYRLRIKNIRRIAEVDKQLSIYEMKALHAQMNPHFIFNCLNSMKEMILTGENANASRYLSSFAQMIRETLDQSKHTFISLEQSISHLEKYIQMEKIRVDDFSYKIKIDNKTNIAEIKIPPMLLQPLVENAIWHGLKSNQGNKTLLIELKKENNKICCIIDDNGQGITKSSSGNLKRKNESTAIANIRDRIALLNEKFDIECSLTITDKADSENHSGSGTIAKLLIPLDIE